MEVKPVITLLVLELSLSECRSLKEKRAVLTPLINHLQRTYKLSVAEIGCQDRWNTSVVGCVLISNDGIHNQSLMSSVLDDLRTRFLNIEILNSRIEGR